MGLSVVEMDEKALNVVYDFLREVNKELSIKHRKRIVRDLFKKHFGFENKVKFVSNKACSYYHVIKNSLDLVKFDKKNEFLEMVNDLIDTEFFEAIIGVEEIIDPEFNDYVEENKWDIRVRKDKVVKQKIVTINDRKYRIFIEITKFN